MAGVRNSRSLALLGTWSRFCASHSLRNATPVSVAFNGQFDQQTGHIAPRSLPGVLQLPTSLGLSRGFASTGVESNIPTQNNRASDAAAVLKVVSLTQLANFVRSHSNCWSLQNLKIGKLHEQLRLTSETVPYILKEKLLKMVQDRSVPAYRYCLQLCPFWTWCNVQRGGNDSSGS